MFGFDEEVFIRGSPELLLSFTAHIVFTSFTFSVKVTSSSMRHAAGVAQALTFTAPRRLRARFSGESRVLQHFLLLLGDLATSADGSLLEGALYECSDPIPDQ